MQSTQLALTLFLSLSTIALASAPGNDPIALAQRLEVELSSLADDARRKGTEIEAAELARIEREIDAGTAEWIKHGSRAEDTAKLHQLRGLLRNARNFNQLRQQRSPEILPYSELAPGLAVRASNETSLGATCANPMDLTRGIPVATTLSAVGTSGDALWVRASVSDAGRTAISTLGSLGDVDITVLSACDDAQPLLVNDDYYGLQALAVLPETTSAGFLVRVGNRDAGRPVAARIEAVLAAGFSGKVSVNPPGTASVASIRIAYFSSVSGYYTGTTYTDSLGNYLMPVSSNGTFYARTGSYPQGNVVHAAYGDIPCSNPDYYSLDSCSPGAPAPITVAANQVTTGIDFQLGLGRVLSFRLSSEADGSPLTSANVSLSTAAGTYDYDYTDATGRATFQGLRVGVNYYASFSAEGHRSESFDNLPCSSSCQSGQGTAISFQATDGYYREHTVQLMPVRRLVVYVRDLPQATYSAVVRLLHPSGQIASSSNAYYSSSLPGWRRAVFTEPAAGNYYLQGGYTESSFWRIHPNIDCLADCQTLLSQAQQIVVSSGPQVNEYFLDPRPFPSVHGNVVDQVSGDAVSGAYAYLVPLPGGYPTTVAVGSGAYRFNYVRPGAYLVAIVSPEHVDVAYPNSPCTGGGSSLVCATATSVTISSTPNASRFDFSLTPSGRISGRMTTEGVSLNHNVQMRLLSSDGTISQGVLDTGLGVYSLSDLTPGDYRVVVEDSSATYGQAYPGVNCAGSSCTSQTLGQLFTLGETALTNIDFDLRMKRGGKGYVLDAITGQPLAGVVVDMWSTSGSGTSYIRSGITGSDGRFVIAAQESWWSSIRLATSVGSSYINEVYNNVQCPIGPAYVGLCDLAQGDALSAVHPMDGQGITFRLAPTGADMLFVDGMED